MFSAIESNPDLYSRLKNKFTDVVREQKRIAKDIFLH